MLTKNKILEEAKERGKLYSMDLVKKFTISRQYVHFLIASLVKEGKLIMLGSTNKAFYVLPEYTNIHREILPLRYVTAFRNKGLEEHKVLDKIEQKFPLIRNFPENIRNIFTYAFSEMFNNAIEHSESVRIGVEVSGQADSFSFTITDSGIGVFRNVMKKRGLKSEMEAIQDILKGKTTTMPRSHTGEGIFFTSKVSDIFILDSYGYQLMIDNELPDVFVKTVNKIKKGTRVIFKISMNSNRYLNDVFMQYTNIGDDSDFGFDKTEIRIKLYAIGGVHISRSQARRVLSGLEKFKIIVFDFDKVPTVGQAFADEVFRVFHNKYPAIKMEAKNMSAGVRFMVERAQNFPRS